MAVYFTKNDDSILFQFSMKITHSTFFLLIWWRFLLKLSGTIVLSWREQETCMLLNKIKSLLQKNLKIVFNIKRNKSLQSKRKKHISADGLTEAFIEAFSGI